MKYKCRKCKSSKVIARIHPTDKTKVGLYCGECGSYIKWLSKQEQRNIGVLQPNTTSTHTKIVPYDKVLQLIKDLHTLSNKSKTFKNTGDRYIMTQDLLSILGNFTFENDITFNK